MLIMLIIMLALCNIYRDNFGIVKIPENIAI